MILLLLSVVADSPTCFASMAAVYSRPKLKSVWNNIIIHTNYNNYNNFPQKTLFLVSKTYIWNVKSNRPETGASLIKLLQISVIYKCGHCFLTLKQQLQ